MKDGNEWNLGCDIGAGHSYGANQIIYMINGRAILVATCPDPDDAAYIVRAVNAFDGLVGTLKHLDREFSSDSYLSDGALHTAIREALCATERNQDEA